MQQLQNKDDKIQYNINLFKEIDPNDIQRRLSIAYTICLLHNKHQKEIKEILGNEKLMRQLRYRFAIISDDPVDYYDNSSDADDYYKYDAKLEKQFIDLNLKLIEILSQIESEIHPDLFNLN